MPRQGRIDYPKALNYVIGRGIERRAIFKEEADKAAFLKRIKDNLSKHAQLEAEEQIKVKDSEELLNKIS
ncbi:MAG: hypothetical protein L6416_12325 [Candidatus Omnitrophica bacterium]|nr:hypothetical protein [Candidatus Omnitrophota bacterium]